MLGRLTSEFAFLNGSDTQLLAIACVFGANREIGAGEIAALSSKGRKPSTRASTPRPF